MERAPKCNKAQCNCASTTRNSFSRIILLLLLQLLLLLLELLLRSKFVLWHYFNQLGKKQTSSTLYIMSTYSFKRCISCFLESKSHEGFFSTLKNSKEVEVLPWRHSVPTIIWFNTPSHLTNAERYNEKHCGQLDSNNQNQNPNHLCSSITVQHTTSG